VCGHGAPPAEEFREIVESGGGRWLPRLPSLPKKGGGSPARDDVVVIASADTKKALKAPEHAYIKQGPGRGAYTPELVFRAVMTQRMDFDDDILVLQKR
jgi:hypothetical protein